MKRFFCIVLCLTLFFYNISANAWYSFETSDKTVTFIIEVEGDPLSYSGKAAFSSKENDSRLKLMSAVTEDVAPGSNIRYVYNHLFNGFSVEADLNKIEELRSLPGVKDVYISSEKHLPEPMMTSAGELTGTQYSYDMGYDGEGTVIAILDAGCNTSHPFFQASPTNPKYSKDDISSLVTTNALNSGVKSSDIVYKNAKIPYAYNYATKSADVYYSNNAHGTHVAGIAAGKNGTATDGSTFSGVAPEAQLLIMTCATPEGSFPDDAILAAIEDSYILGADVINMSFGSDYADSDTDRALDKMIQNAKAAGVAVVSAAGNASKGFDKKTPLAIHPDYSTNGTPSGFSAVTAVASADTSPASAAGKVSSFSSWGVDTSLELKPEITAPGRNIYSSVPNGGYDYASGTSMASPHMAGIYALALQYYNSDPFIDEYNDLSNKVDLIENIAMNSAEIILQSDNTPYSPRVQGAGLVNMENLINSRVILTGNSGKAKLNLGDNLGSFIPLQFDITNISKEAVTFNSISFDVLTDGATSTGRVSDSVCIPFTANAPSSVTIASGQTYTFKATLSLDEDFLNTHSATFSNGFFIDGFVTLKGDNVLYSSLPFTGFYGDFGAAPIFDSTIYDNGGSTLFSDKETGFPGTFLAMSNNNSYLPLGRNIVDTDIVDGKFVSYSPSSGYGLEFIGRNYRTTSDLTFSLVNSSGKTVLTTSYNGITNKYKKYYYTLPSTSFAKIADGNYTFRVDGTLNGKTGITDSLEIPLMIDNTAPEIVDASYNAANKTVTVMGKDNHFISCIMVGYINSSGKVEIIRAAVNNETDIDDGIVTKTLNVSNIENPENIQLLCMDYASNATELPLALYTDTIGARLIGLNRLETVTQAKFTVRNNTSASVNARIIAAFFDASGTLIATTSASKTLTSETDTPVIYGFLADTRSAAYVRLFIWTPQSMIPVDSSKIFNLAQ